MEDALKDERFKHILTDSRFRSMPKHIQKVTIDKRFKGMFKDKNFKGRGLIDARGRPLNLTPSENLKNLYEVSSDSSENEEGENMEDQKGYHKMQSMTKIDVTKPHNKKKSNKKQQLSEEQEKSSKNLKYTVSKHSESFSLNKKSTRNSEMQSSKSFETKEQSLSEDDLENGLPGEESVVNAACKGNFTKVTPKHSEPGSLKKKKSAKKNKLYGKCVDSPKNHLTQLSNKELSSIIDDDSKESSEAEKNAISIVNAHLEAKHSETNSLKKKNSPHKNRLHLKHAKSIKNQLEHLSNKELSSIIDDDSNESTEEEIHTKSTLNRNLKDMKNSFSKGSNFTPKNKIKEMHANFSKKHSTPISVRQDQSVLEADSDEESSEDNRNLFKINCNDSKSKNAKLISKKAKSVMKNKIQKESSNNSRNLSAFPSIEQEQSDSDDEIVSSEEQINSRNFMGGNFDKQKSKKHVKNLKTNNSLEQESSNDSQAESSEEMNLNIFESSTTSKETRNGAEFFSTKKLNSKSNKLSKKKSNSKKNQSLCAEQSLSEDDESEEEMNEESAIEDSCSKSRVKSFKDAANEEKPHIMKMKQKQSSSDDDDDDDSDEESTNELDKKSKGNSNNKKVKHSDSEDSDDSDDSESDGSGGEQTEGIDHRWEELRNEAPDTDDITQRLAVCNMDWDRIRAEDLYVCFKSFKPVDGWINSVKIYPSEYGLKRMEEEKLHGPAELVEETLPLDAEEPEDKKGSRHHREKLRQYQLNRLKYYYAIVDCDSPETANVIYDQLNGMEYESSSIRYDLRFVPDDMTFEHEAISVADNNTDLSDYKPRLFVNTALQQVKVNLTWDETDPKRRDVLQRAFTDPDSVQDDIRNYLASTSGESDEDESTSKEKHDKKLEDRITTYRKLLQSIEEEEKEEKEKYEMEITWDPSLKEKTEGMVKEKMKKDTLNPFEEILQKRKEKRKIKKKEKKTMLRDAESHSGSDDSDESESVMEDKARDAKKLAELALIADSKNEVDMEEKKSKKKKKAKKKEISKVKDEDNLQIDVNDHRFSAIYTSHAFNIDPSSPHFKKTEGSVALVKEKQRRLESMDYHNRHSKRARYS